MSWTVIRDGKRSCIVCCNEKTIDQFPSYAYTTAQGKSSARRGSRCISCEANRRKLRYARHGVRERRASLEWKLSTGYKTPIVAEMSAEALNKKRIQRRFYEAKRRLTHGDNPHTSQDYFAVVDEARFGDLWLDAYSGELISNPTVDHIDPIAKGGLHTFENLCVTSKANNSSKRSRSFLIWLCER
jgi:hypothetical protein